MLHRKRYGVRSPLDNTGRPAHPALVPSIVQCSKAALLSSSAVPPSSVQQVAPSSSSRMTKRLLAASHPLRGASIGAA